MNKSKKGGRPESEIKRDRVKKIYFTEEEFEKINDMFFDGDYRNINEMLRDIILNGKYEIISDNREERLQRMNLLDQVKRIGNNFNQLVKSLNQRKMDSLTRNDINMLHKNIINIRDIYIKINDNISNYTYKRQEKCQQKKYP